MQAIAFKFQKTSFEFDNFWASDRKKYGKNVILENILCIYYLLYFQKYIIKIKLLINCNDKIKIITLAYIL